MYRYFYDYVKLLSVPSKHYRNVNELWNRLLVLIMIDVFNDPLLDSYFHTPHRRPPETHGHKLLLN